MRRASRFEGLELDSELYICRLRAMRTRKCSKQTIAVLSALLAQPGQWRHGYDLSKETGLKSGTLYPILMRLSDRGLLESSWHESPKPGRPPRHMYRLTRQGIALAREQVLACERAAAGSTCGRRALDSPRGIGSDGGRVARAPSA